MKAKKRDTRKAAPTPTQKSARPEFWLYALGLLAGLFAAFQVYGPALHGPFLFDDSYLPMNVPAVKDGPLSLWIGGVRPLLMFSYWINYQSAGADATPYHVWNIFCHFLDALLVYFIVRKLLQLAGAPQILALFAGGLFLLHPLQTEAVAYIVGRSDSLCSLL